MGDRYIWVRTYTRGRPPADAKRPGGVGGGETNNPQSRMSNDPGGTRAVQRETDTQKPKDGDEKEERERERENLEESERENRKI